MKVVSPPVVPRLTWIPFREAAFELNSVMVLLVMVALMSPTVPEVPPELMSPAWRRMPLFPYWRILLLSMFTVWAPRATVLTSMSVPSLEPDLSIPETPKLLFLILPVKFP